MAMNPKLLRPKASVAPFSPQAIAGLALWLDAADASSITLNGNGVSAWGDKSENGLSVIQPTALYQPQYTATIGGKPALLFGGAASPAFLGCEGGSFANETFFMVAARNNGSQEAYAALFAYRQSANTYLSSDADSEFVLNRGTVSDDALGFDPITSTPTLYTNGVNIPAGSVDGIATENSYSSSPFAVADAQSLLTIYSGTSIAGAKPFIIGADAYEPASRTYRATVGEILIYQNALSEAERQSVEAYLMSKWGIT